MWVILPTLFKGKRTISTIVSIMVNITRMQMIITYTELSEITEDGKTLKQPRRQRGQKATISPSYTPSQTYGLYLWQTVLEIHFFECIGVS